MIHRRRQRHRCARTSVPILRGKLQSLFARRVSPRFVHVEPWLRRPTSVLASLPGSGFPSGISRCRSRNSAVAFLDVRFHFQKYGLAAHSTNSGVSFPVHAPLPTAISAKFDCQAFVGDQEMEAAWHGMSALGKSGHFARVSPMAALPPKRSFPHRLVRRAQPCGFCPRLCKPPRPPPASAV